MSILGKERQGAAPRQPRWIRCWALLGRFSLASEQVRSSCSVGSTFLGAAKSL